MILLVQLERFAERLLHVLADPRVTHHIVQRQTRAAVLQQFRDQILCARRDELRIADLDAADLRVSLLAVLGLERRTADEELVAQHAKAPLVDGVVVALVLDHLWRQIIQRSAHRLAVVGHRVGRPAEVGELDVIVGGEQNVLRLQVAVHDVVQVAIVERISHLVRVLRRAVFLEPRVGRALQVPVKLPLARQLQRDVNFLLIVEPREEPQNVRMPRKTSKLTSLHHQTPPEHSLEPRLDLELPQHLLLDSPLR